jgi:hypothetical protein
VDKRNPENYRGLLNSGYEIYPELLHKILYTSYSDTLAEEQIGFRKADHVQMAALCSN